MRLVYAQGAVGGVPHWGLDATVQLCGLRLWSFPMSPQLIVRCTDYGGLWWAGGHGPNFPLQARYNLDKFCLPWQPSSRGK